MNYEENINKEKRIAFLSVFSSICRTGQIDTETAGKVVDSLFNRYPADEEPMVRKPIQNNSKPMQPRQGNKPTVKQTTEQCPSCGKNMRELEGDSYSNYYKKMVHYRMLVCPDSNKDGSGPCQQKPIKLPVFNKEQQAKAQSEDAILEESNQNYDESVPAEYQ